MTRRKKMMIGGGGLIAVVAVVGLNAGRGERATEVRLETVGYRSLVATVTASGQIQPTRQVDISSDITGRIIDLPVDEGDWVNQGDLLVRIDPSQYDAAVARAQAGLSSAQASAIQARANREQARRALNRSLELRGTDSTLVSPEQVEQAQTSFDVADAVAISSQHQVEQARAALQEAQEQLAKTILRSPMAGQITRLAVEEGEVAVPGTFSRETGLLMTVSDLSVIQVNVRVDETDVVRLHLGDSTDVEIDAYPDTTFTGRVTKVARSAVRAAAAGQTGDQAVDYDVEITLDNPPPDIRPDLSATAKIVTDTRDSAMAIPIIALTVREHTPIATEDAPRDTTTKEMEGVFVVSGGLAQFRPVKVGIAGEEHFEVLEGLSAGDTIVAGPYQTIRDLSDSTRVRPSSGSFSESDTTSTAPAATPASEAPAASSNEAATTAAVDTSDSLYYSVQVAALGSVESAVAYAEDFQGYGPATISAVRLAEDRVLYRVMVGALPSSAQAESLQERLLGDGLLDADGGMIVRTPHALQLAVSPDYGAGQVALEQARLSGIRGYLLAMSTGQVQLVTGAFESADQAYLTDSMLPQFGSSHVLVLRTGTVQ